MGVRQAGRTSERTQTKNRPRSWLTAQDHRSVLLLTITPPLRGRKKTNRVQFNLRVFYTRFSVCREEYESYILSCPNSILIRHFEACLAQRDVPREILFG